MTDTYEKNDIVGKADSAAVIDIGSNSIRYAAGRNGKKTCNNNASRLRPCTNRAA